MVEEVAMAEPQEVVAEEKTNEDSIQELKNTVSKEEEINNAEPVEEQTNGHHKVDNSESNDEKPAAEDGAANTETQEAETTEAEAANTETEAPLDNNLNKEPETNSAAGGATEAAAESSTSPKKADEAQVNGGGEDKNVEAKKEGESLGATVAKHYNERPAGSKDIRKESRIFHLRNFNNWAKSTLINEFLEKVKRRKRTSDDIVILDLACGKGGDLLKWQKGKVDHVIMADIASTSIDQCKERYARLEKESKQSRHRDRLFAMEAFAADCTKVNISEEHFRKKDIKVDLTSCQFAFHYAFESYDQAVTMVKNACERLNTGGYWIGTMPDANLLVKKMQASEDGSFGNSVYKITPDNKDDTSLFGAKYMFHLEGVVDCPEFLVHFPVVEKLAEKHGMKLVWKKNFHDLYKYMEKDHSSLLHRMSALECYPASSGKALSAEEEEYNHAKEYMTEKDVKRVGTLTKDEWEAAGLYLAFAFEKIESGEKKERSREDSRKRTRDSSREASRDRHRSRDSSRKDRRDSRDRSHSKTATSDSDRKRSSGSSRDHRSSSAKRSRKDTEEEQPEFVVADEVTGDEETTTAAEPAAEPAAETTPETTAEASTEEQSTTAEADSTNEQSEAATEEPATEEPAEDAAVKEDAE